ncbi:putative alpha/Beta hydrolase [Helianthus anomalus]
MEPVRRGHLTSCVYHNESTYVVLQFIPPHQATKIHQALEAKGLPVVVLVEYEGEQHGFRKAEIIKFTLEQQMVFFARLVGHFKVADKIVPIKIDNFD